MNLSLAPIQGMTVSFYRNAFHEIFGGIDSYYSPFITTTNPNKLSPKLFKDLLPEKNSKDINLIPQLLSNKGEDFNHYTAYLVEMGYSTINWNIGCPYPTVTKKKRGSGILAYPDLLESFLETVCKDLKYELSIKMRLGLNHIDEGLRAIEIINEYPIKEVAIHGRLGIQKYQGHSDQEAFMRLAQPCKHPLIYNGDIFTEKDYKKINSKLSPYGISEYMLARGLLRNPFLAGEIKGIHHSKSQKREMLVQFHQNIYENYQDILSGDKHLLDRMKEFCLYLSYTLDPDERYYKQIKKAKNKSEYEAAVRAMFSQ